MRRFRHYLVDIVVGMVFLLLIGIRGFSDWKFHEYALFVIIYGYIVFLRHKR